MCCCVMSQEEGLWKWVRHTKLEDIYTDMSVVCLACKLADLMIFVAAIHSAC